MDGANVGTQALSVTLDGIESVLTAHNLLFTTLTLGLLVPKAILCYEGKSAAPNALDWFYGVVVAVAFYWLGQYHRYAPSRYQWYFRAHFPSLLADGLNRLNSYYRRIRHTYNLNRGLIPGFHAHVDVDFTLQALELANDHNRNFVAITSGTDESTHSGELRLRIPRLVSVSTGRVDTALSTFRELLDSGIIQATEIPFLYRAVEAVVFITDTFQNATRLSFHYLTNRRDDTVLPVHLQLEERGDTLEGGMREQVESVIRRLLSVHGWHGWRGFLANLTGERTARQLSLDPLGVVEITGTLDQEANDIVNLDGRLAESVEYDVWVNYLAEDPGPLLDLYLHRLG